MDRLHSILHIGDGADLLLHLGKLRCDLRNIADRADLILEIGKTAHLFFYGILNFRDMLHLRLHLRELVNLLLQVFKRLGRILE